MSDLLWYKVTVGLKGEGYSERSIIVAAPTPELAQAYAQEQYVEQIEVSEPVVVDLVETLMDTLAPFAAEGPE